MMQNLPVSFSTGVVDVNGQEVLCTGTLQCPCWACTGHMEKSGHNYCSCETFRGVKWKNDKFHKIIHNAILNNASKDLIEKECDFFAMHDEDGNCLDGFSDEECDAANHSLVMLQRTHEWHSKQKSNCSAAIREERKRLDLAAFHEDAARVIRRATERANAAEARFDKLMACVNVLEEKDMYVQQSLLESFEEVDANPRIPISFKNVTDWSAEFEEAVFQEERAQCAAVAKARREKGVAINRLTTWGGVWAEE